MMSDRDELRGFLRVLAAPGLLEVRTRIGRGRGMRQRFFDRSRETDAAALITEVGADTDVYVGVLRRAHATGARSAVRRADVLWADCDTEEARYRLATFVPQPTMVVASGSTHGRHAYWRLMEPIDPDAAEALNRGIARALRADLHSTDPARILRPPATRNFKRAPATPVRLLSATDERFDVDHFAVYLPLAPACRQCVPSRPRSGDPLLTVEPRRYVNVLLGVEPDRSGKVPCPFHEDRTPSLHVYPTPERGWFCFGCRRGTSIYDLASALWGITPRGEGFLELRRRLRQLFGV